MEKAKRVFTQTFGTVGAVLEKNGKILLVREATKEKFDYGKWNIPEGWIRVGENLLDAAKREVQEETGFPFEPTYILGIYSMVREDMDRVTDGTPHAIKIMFLGEIDDSKMTDLHDDISETKWFTPEEIENMGKEKLRNADIKKIVKDYFSGRRYPLELIRHTVQ